MIITNTHFLGHSPPTTMATGATMPCHTSGAARWPVPCRGRSPRTATATRETAVGRRWGPWLRPLRSSEVDGVGWSPPLIWLTKGKIKVDNIVSLSKMKEIHRNPTCIPNSKGGTASEHGKDHPVKIHQIKRFLGGFTRKPPHWTPDWNPHQNPANHYTGTKHPGTHTVTSWNILKSLSLHRKLHRDFTWAETLKPMLLRKEI